MTLAKKIEEAREALNTILENIDCDTRHKNQEIANYAHILCNEIKQALAALPDKPMTEDEMLKLIAPKVVGVGSGILHETGLDMCRDVIRALKDADVLYIAE